MSRKALLRNVIHTIGANLHLNPSTLLRHHRGVQRLIAVSLRMVDPVAQAIRMTLVDLVQGNINLETFIDLILPVLGDEHNTHGEDVIDLLKRHVLILHLAPDGVGALDACLDMIGEAHLVE